MKSDHNALQPETAQRSWIAPGSARRLHIATGQRRGDQRGVATGVAAARLICTTWRCSHHSKSYKP